MTENLQALKAVVSLPVRGAWIEISERYVEHGRLHPSLPVRGAWIEIPCDALNGAPVESLPVRGAWIEICRCI